MDNDVRKSEMVVFNCDFSNVKSVLKNIKLDIEKRIEGAKQVGDHKPSTLQDFEAKKPLELNALIKSLVELGNLTNTKIPTINTIFQLSKYFAVKNNCYVE